MNKLIEIYKHFGNNFTGSWLVYGGGCLMQRQYIVNSGSLMQVELSKRWLIQQVQLYCFYVPDNTMQK